MTDPHTAASRDTRGRFQPGASGNPAGKKPGTLNHATLWRRRLAEGDADGFADQIIGFARDGDFRAIRFVLDRIDPKPRGRAVTLDFPLGSSVLERFMRLSAALADGEITPDEARTVALVLDLEGRERARTAAAEMALVKNREAYQGDEIERASKRLNALFPVCVWLDGEPDAKPDAEAQPEPASAAEPAPDLHPACNSGADEPDPPHPVMPGLDPGIMAAAPAAAAAPPVTMAGSSPAMTDGVGVGAGAGADLHSACISPSAADLPTPRRRAVNRLRAQQAAAARSRP